MRTTYFLLLIILTTKALGQTTPEALFAEGNAHLGEKRYEEAVRAYAQAQQAGAGGFDFHFNAGTAAFRAGHLGLAAYFWEKARQHRPADADLRHNLRVVYARAKDGLPDLEDRPWARFRNLADADGWGTIALLLALPGALGLAFFVLRKNAPSTRAAGLGGTALLLLALAAFSMAQQQHDQLRGRFVVVVAPQTALLSAPDASATPLDTLREAAKLPLIDQLGAYFQVRLPNGETWWVRAGEVAVI